MTDSESDKSTVINSNNQAPNEVCFYSFINIFFINIIIIIIVDCLSLLSVIILLPLYFNIIIYNIII